MPDLFQFDPEVCTSYIAQRFCLHDRQANNTNGNCATLYDYNCIGEDVTNNTNICCNELAKTPYVNDVNANRFSIFDGNAPDYCRGFSWSTGE